MKKIYLERTAVCNVKQLIQRSVNKFSNNTAFVLKHKSEKNTTYEKITYKKLYSDINSFGTALLDNNSSKKRIAVIGKNSYEWAVTYFTALCGAGIIVPLDKGLPFSEIVFSLQKSKADVVVFDSEHLEDFNKLKNENSTSVKTFICMRENNFNFPTIKDFINKGLEKIKKSGNKFKDVKIDNDALSLILFTSGTTTLAKAVMLSQTNIMVSANVISRIIPLYENDVSLALLPFHHTFGALNLMYFIDNGACLAFSDGLRYIADNLKEYHVTAFICVPLLLENMYKKIMTQIDKSGKTNKVKFAIKFSNFLRFFGIDIRRKLFKDIIDGIGGLRVAMCGASSLDPKVQKAFNDFGIRTSQGYGLTETAPILTAPTYTKDKCGSCGTSIPGVEIKIDNPNEHGIGEIIARGANVMLGYYEDELATNEVIVDGWFHTGDLGYIDKDGFCYITGRKKNVIVLKNGKNIYPEELEVLVNKLPYVQESMVFGYPKDDDYLLSVKVVYNKKLLVSRLTIEEIRDKIWLDIKEINKALPKYKHIKNLIITEEALIKTTTSKIKRNEELKKILSCN